jgi:hypothetical protein
MSTTELVPRIAPERRLAWSKRLEQIAAGPLGFCPDFADAAERWEAWWRFEAARPLLHASARKTGVIRWGKAFDLVANPRQWLDVRVRQLEATRFVGETIPFIRADIGPVTLAAYLGAELHLAEEEQTSWQTPFVEDWDDLSWIELDPENLWLQRVLALLDILAHDAKGRYAVCLPDLTGALDTLSNLRSPDRLCMDLFDNRESVAKAAARVVDAWETVFATMYDLILGSGAGVVQWLGCWSNEPYTIPTCDFNALIGPKDFAEVRMPPLHDQAIRAGRCVFHLDGPAAARHARTLAEDPAITAIQYTPGAGTPSAAAMLPMLRMVQGLGRPLYVVCPVDEVERLAGELDPRGTVLAIHSSITPQEADRLERIVCG